MSKYLLFISLTLSTIASPQLAQAQTLLCKVVNVSDGDTINCLDKDKTQHRVRLSEIDAPERKQAFGQKARNYLRDLVIHKNVQIRVDGRDRYKRVLGTVYINQRNINLEMVQSGYAWAYVRYLKDPAYTKAEAQARRHKRGIWAEGNAIYPEDFRRHNRR